MRTRFGNVIPLDNVRGDSAYGKLDPAAGDADVTARCIRANTDTEYK